MFGVLLADPDYLSADTAAGLRLAMMNIQWNEWEPEQGSFDSAYISQQEAAVAHYLAAGWTVAVDVGLQTPPSWALDLPYGQLVDQDGNSSGTPDYEFSAAVRAAAATYITSVVSSLSGVSYYRIGLSTSGELLYPPAPDNQWWAFSPLAQGSATGLPSGVGAAPMPGWCRAHDMGRWTGENPGHGAVLVRLVLRCPHKCPHVGDPQLPPGGLPGTVAVRHARGRCPAGPLPKRIAAEPAPNSDDSYYTMNTGAVWWYVLPELPLTGAVVDISSVGDGSGDPVNNVCQASDASVNYTSQPSAIESGRPPGG